MRNKDYQTMASFPSFMRGGLGACCSSNKSVVSLRTIHAKVVDEFGDILPGVSVWPEGEKTQGVTTDIDGNFTLKNVPIDSVINFSYVTTITKKTALQIDDVVVIKTALENDEVVINAPSKKDQTLKYMGYGLLALVVLYGLSKMGKEDKPVKASV
ncbi:carboxypeptidase-like regulatory domain-containing protein [Gelidibacter japonicus]|uniref:carboxypeptidase-like regulatory domain-containing protein n=1 Tax=Gelidibacter japonicus TaxID=1962232 RepID=UPI002AFED91B|nr:carboxypeptidase-like regulatory domain-containing protein [Gelidibacter japonicus]